MNKLLLKPVHRQAPSGAPPVAGEQVIIAVDLSRSKWVYVCRWKGQEQRRLSTPGEIGHLQALVREYLDRDCRVKLVYEACGFGYEIAWWLQEQPRAEVLVVAPSTVEKAPGAGVKTDGLDAGAMALKHEKELLKGIRIPSRAQHQDRQLSRTYAQVLSDRRREQTRLRLLLQEHGYSQVPTRQAGWKALESWLKEQRLAEPVAVCVAELLGLRMQADRSAQRLRQRLVQIGKQPRYAGLVKALRAQPGVGPFTAIRFILEIGDMERFATADALPNYLGLTPREYSSGEMVHRGHVRKCGPGSLRAWLIQCAWAAVRSNEDRALVECFERLSARAGRKRAIVAVARKLALRLRARWLAAERALEVAA